MIALVVAICLLFLLVYRRRSDHSLLLNCGYPVIPSQNIITENIDVFLCPTAHIVMGKIAERYGSVFGAMQGGMPTVVVSDANVVKSISQQHFSSFHAKIPAPLDPDPVFDENVHMFASRGARWKRMRFITSEAMSSKNMKKLFPIVEESVGQFLNYIGSLSLAQPVDAHRLFQRHTSDVLARCAFGQAQSRQDKNLYFDLFKQAFGNEMQVTGFNWSIASMCFPQLDKVLRRMRIAVDNVLQFAHEVKSPLMLFSHHLANLRQHRRPKDEKYDFLQFFKDSEDSSFNGFVNEQSSGRVKMTSIRINKTMAPGETVAQCRFIAIAGFDTTANTLALLCDLLSKNPQKQELLLQEIDAVESFTYDNILSMRYLHNCIFETLRLYPHASPLQHRLCMENCEVPPYFFKKGTYIIINPWPLHHNHHVWGDDVEEFRPERFNSLTDEQLRAFMPFGLGPRQCVGMRFALMEMKLTLCVLFSRYRLKDKDKTEQVSVTFRDTGTLWPEKIATTQMDNENDIAELLIRFKVSKEFGFLSRCNLDQLHEYYQPWVTICENMSDLIRDQNVGEAVRGLPELTTEWLATYEDWRLAHLLLTTITSGYIWSGGPQKAPSILPKNVAVPLMSVSRQLGVRPVVCHASACLANWNLIDPSKPFSPDNMQLNAFKFLESRGNHWFFVVTAQIEKDFAPCIYNIIRTMHSTNDNDLEIRKALISIKNCLEKAATTMKRLPEHLTPTEFYNELRPFLWGYNEGLLNGHGIVFEGAERKFLIEQRDYMPREHRELILWVESHSPVGLSTEGRQDAVDSLYAFRSAHLKTVAYFILTATGRSSNNLGTGGTPFMQFLKNVRAKCVE
ncbi:hypothetical protein Q1695_000510 [Nippostrongylus brasiliensis]|nr:hypothetical protein Q1695_000510 [Nippostrongylus brasiliensis]